MALFCGVWLFWVACDGFWLLLVVLVDVGCFLVAFACAVAFVVGLWRLGVFGGVWLLLAVVG